MEYEFSVIMLGPDPSGLGGISRVIKNWQNGRFLIDNKIYYLATVNEDQKINKHLFFIMAFVRFINLCILRPNAVAYIHTASFNSFYRKSLFLLVAYLFKKDFVLHIHPSYFYHFIYGFRGIKKKIFYTLLKRSSCFIVLTNEMQDNMKRIFPYIPIFVLPNPVNVDAMALDTAYEREDNRLLYLGWYTKGKGVYDLVDAASMLSEKKIDFKLDFYGTKELVKLKSYVAEKNIEGRVSVNGWADDETKLKALYRSAALILPSHTEGIPNVVLEAMATKTPVVSTRVGGLSGIIKTGENAIVIEPHNPRDIAEKIEFVLKNRNYCKKLADRAFQETKQYYDLPVIKDRLQTILQRYSSKIT